MDPAVNAQRPLGGERFELSHDVLVWREVDDEVVVLEMESGSYLNLSGSAKVLWMALSLSASVDDLIEVPGGFIWNFHRTCGCRCVDVLG